MTIEIEVKRGKSMSMDREVEEETELEEGKKEGVSSKREMNRP